MWNVLLSVRLSVLMFRLIKEMYSIVPHVERLEDIRKSLQQTVHDACAVKTVMFISYHTLATNVCAIYAYTVICKTKVLLFYELLFS